MKNVVSFLILAAAWGHAALPAAATSAALPFDGFVSAVSADSAAVRLEVRNMALVAPRVVSGTQSLVSSNGLTAIAWDTTALANGWQEVTEPTGGEKASLLVANPPSIAVEGGRLQSNATWTSNAVHWVCNRVVGSAEGPVVFSSAEKGDYAITVLDGGTFTDAYAQFGNTTVSQHPTLSIPGGCEVSERNERVQIPVSLSGDRSSATCSTRRSRAERSSSW